ncbi:trafficking protein particle complex subunit 6B [Dichotomopilus funicola]|uniref:Trafficking protein particle complex subunit 6B n=1 Tax=Dichotomopilus funicola TaxID=1934379 RepID=A0AAN6V7S6_9PEZI|nr:trafficking protein particle complex subunit 6B [Dichotomopilus funicola]
MSFEAVMPPYNASDPTARFLSSSCFDFLLIELVPMAYRVANDLEAAALARERAGFSGDGDGDGDESEESESGSGSSEEGDEESDKARGGIGSETRGASGLGSGDVADDREEREAALCRLEAIGYRVGQGLVERFSRERPRFNDTLDVIKFICKDLWTLVFRKQVDNLKTNHRGVYVLTDNAFRPFSRMSAQSSSQAVIGAQPFLRLPCGIVRGALAGLGISATVQAETTELPSAIFQIKTVSAKT